jgi:4-nitrophenyl phosphatase
LKQYKAYLIDLDGTMYRGEEQIEAASDFVKALKQSGIPYLFVTNNSSKTPEQVAEKLHMFDIPSTAEHIITSSTATALYLKNHQPNASVYFIGEEGLEKALIDGGFPISDENPDVVVVGLDRQITYEKLAKACLGVRNGADFILTNADIAIPTEQGLLPGNGSLASVISTSTEKTPLIIGKPEAIIMEESLRVLKLGREEVIMVGDNYMTDILAGIKAGIDTLFVETGVTSAESLPQYKHQPTYSVSSLQEWLPNIK